MLYGRCTPYQFDPSKTDEVIEKMDAMKQKIQSIPGIKHCLSSWREDGNGITVAVYEDQAAADAATETVKAIWTEMAGDLTAAPVTELYDAAEDLLS